MCVTMMRNRYIVRERERKKKERERERERERLERKNTHAERDKLK